MYDTRYIYLPGLDTVHFEEIFSLQSRGPFAFDVVQLCTDDVPRMKQSEEIAHNHEKESTTLTLEELTTLTRVSVVPVEPGFEQYHNRYGYQYKMKVGEEIIHVGCRGRKVDPTSEKGNFVIIAAG